MSALDGLAVAFSGGVDSAVVAALAHRALGERTFAVTAVSETLSDREYLEATELAREIGDPADFVPQIGIDQRATIALGGEKIELVFMGHGHSRGDLVIYLPERRVLFAGDLVFTGAHGRCKTTDFGGILAILDALSQFPCDTVVPGHGIPVVGEGAQAIATYRDYLVSLQERVAELVDSGVGLAEAKTKFGDWKYAKWVRPELLPTAIEHAYKDYVWRSRFYKFQTLREEENA